MTDLQLIKWVDKGGKEQHLRTIENISDKWKKLGTTFGIPPPVLTGYAKVNMQEQEDCCRDVIQRWLQDGSRPRESYPVSWIGLIKALRDSGINSAASDLKEALPRKKKI